MTDDRLPAPNSTATMKIEPSKPAPASHPEQRLVRVRWIALLALFAAFAILPAFTTNLGAYAHDAAAEHVPRGLIFSNAISDGFLYPRWVQFLHLGLGSPLFTFQPPLPYYGMDAFYRILGLGHPLGWRILIGAGLLTAFFGMYCFVRELAGRRWPALLAAVAFLYAPYVLRNGLERGSNEAFGMFLYPWVLWGLLYLARRPSAGRFAMASLLWAACIGMHVLAPLMLAPVALSVAILAGWRWRTFAPLLALLFGGLLMAFVWMPMAAEQNNVHVEWDFNDASAIPADNPIPLDRLLALPAVYDIARDNNSMGDRIGLAHTLLLFASLLGVGYALLRRRYEQALILGLATFVGLLLFWMFTASSNFIWHWFDPILHRVQYRTRLMGVQALAASTAIGLLIALLPERKQRYASTLLAGLLLLLAIPSLYVGLQHRFGHFADAMTLEQVRQIEWNAKGSSLTAFDEFLPRWRKGHIDEALMADLGQDFDPQERPLVDPAPGLRVSNVRITSSSWDMDLTTDSPQTLTLHLLYYPRWQALLNGHPIAVRPQPESGFVQVQIPRGSHHLSLSYRSTLAERLGWGISLLTVAGLFWALLWEWRRRGKRKKAPSKPHASVAPPLWLLLGLTAFFLLKALVLDAHTTAFRCQSSSEHVCGAQTTVNVSFPGGGHLRGYTVSSYKMRPGDTVRINLFWEASPDMIDPLHSFVHIRNSQPDQPFNPRTENDIWAQEDHVTPGGLLSRDWIPGKLYLDEFRITLPSDMPPGAYNIEVGWMDANTGEQLDPDDESIIPPMKELWRSVLLPKLSVQE